MILKLKYHFNSFFQFTTTFMIFHYAIVKRTISNNYGTKYPIIIDIAALIGTIIFLLFSITTISLCGIYKCTIYIYLCLRFGRHFHGMITGIDMLTILAPGCDGSIHGLTECSTGKPFNGRELYDKFCAQIYKKFYLTKVDRKLFSTREYTIFGYNYFRETCEVQVEEIVKFIKSPHRHAGEPIEEDELMELAQRYYNSDLPVNNKFNWDICICLNPIAKRLQKNPKNLKTHFVVFTRMHHTLGDGLVIFNIMVNNIFQMGPEFKTYTKNLVNKCMHLEHRSTPQHVYKFGYKNLIDKPCLLRDGKRHVKTMYTSRVEEPSDLCFLDKMQVIRQKFPGVVTFNIFMTAFSASLAEYYLKHSSIEIPEKIESTYPVQLNIKRYLDIYASSEKIQLSNEVTSYTFECPLIPRNKRGIPIKDYLVERMLELKEDLYKAFNSMDAQANYIWSRTYYNVLPYQITRNLFHGIFMQTLTTCMPGGPKLKLFNDDYIHNITYFLPRQYYSTLLLSMNTYDHRLQVGLTADEEKIESIRNLNEIRDGIFIYLDHLYEQCLKYEPIQKHK